jgi:hypothetical protein
VGKVNILFPMPLNFFLIFQEFIEIKGKAGTNYSVSINPITIAVDRAAESR